MKSLTYNPAVALSILLAAVFLEKYPETEVKTTTRNGTDFLGKLKEEGFTKTEIVSVLDDQDSDYSKRLALSIQSELHDVTKFEHSFELLKIYRGDLQLQGKLVENGAVIENFVKSPSFESTVEDLQIFNQEEGKLVAGEEILYEAPADGPVTDTTGTGSLDNNTGKAPLSDVK